MISKQEKAFRDADFNSNTKPGDIDYKVGEQFDKAGLPNPYIEDQDEIDPVGDPTNQGRDGRGLPTEFGIVAETNTTTIAKPVTKKTDLAKVA